MRANPPGLFQVRYFGNSVTTFHLEYDDHGGTDLTMTDTGILPEDRVEVVAGWVSVLMALKAYVDFDVDLRTLDSTRHWDIGYVQD